MCIHRTEHVIKRFIVARRGVIGRGHSDMTSPVNLKSCPLSYRFISEIISSRNGLETRKAVFRSLAPCKVDCHSLIPGGERYEGLFIAIYLSSSRITCTSVHVRPGCVILKRTTKATTNLTVSKGSTIRSISCRTLGRELLGSKRILRCVVGGG